MNKSEEHSYIIALLVLQSITRAWLFDVLLDCAVGKELFFFSGKAMMTVIINLSWALQGCCCHAPDFLLSFPDCKHLGQIFIFFENICLLISICLITAVYNKCHLNALALFPYVFILYL